MSQLTEKCYYTLENGVLTLGNKYFSKTFAGVDTVSVAELDGEGLSVPYTELTATGEGRTRRYCVWPELSAVYMPDYDEKELLTLTGEHWVARSVNLNAFTDENDTLTDETELHMFARKLFKPLTGEIFFLEDPESGNAYVIISENPDYQTATLNIRGGVVTVENGSCALVLGFCKIGECEALCRAYYRHARKPQQLVTMSNTWGDRNGFERVCRDFILKEIDAARDIGVDIVQIDDGWQVGSTADPKRRDEKGRREFSGDFWDLDTERFPNAMREITDYAAKDGIKIGLWFAPDSHGTFELLDRDISVLRRAYDEWGFRFFKLDMYWVLNTAERDQFLKLLQAIYSFGDDVAVQLDVTRNARMNYLSGRQYGTVFVENRYTGSGNSFPHRILRNLWMIGHYLPTSKFQFEMINPELYKECYKDTDPFAPANYDMDYLFASVMLSNPLFWMEMQFLPQNRRRQLDAVMKVWKEHRAALSVGDVKPIGEKPSGRSMTGFSVSRDGKAEYLLLFREVTDRDSAIFEVSVDKTAKAEVLISNADAKVEVMDGAVRVQFSKERGYAFVKLN